MSRTISILVYALAGAFFTVFLLFPLTLTLASAFLDADHHWTPAYLAAVFRDPVYVEGLRNAFLLALATTGATFLIAVPLAWLANRFDFAGKRALSALVLTPMMLPPFVGVIGIKKILGRQGALNALLHHSGLLAAGDAIDWLGQHRFWGVVILNALHLYPILYLNAAAALSNIDPSMEEAAENLGCTGWRKFVRITLPLMAPGIFAGGTIVFIWAFTELGTPLLLDYTRVTPVQIFYGIKDIGSSPLPYALVAIMLIVTCLLYAASRLVFARRHDNLAMMAKAGARGGPRAVSRRAGLCCAAVFGGVSLLALLPHLGVVLVAFSRDWYGTVLPAGWTLGNFQAALGHPLTVPSIANSLRYAALSTAFDLLLGVAIAYVIARTDLPGRGLLDAASMLPLAVPGLVLAFGYLAMTQEGKLFYFLNPIQNPTPLLVIAYAMRRLPYMVRSAAAGLQQTSVTLEEAARSLGCPPARTLWRITFPLIAENLLAGGLLTFSLAMLEVSDSLILAQTQTSYPITKAIYELFNLLGTGRAMAAALGVWAMVFLGLTLVAARVLLGKKMDAMFRG